MDFVFPSTQFNSLESELVLSTILRLRVHRNDTDALTRRRETRLLQNAIPQAQCCANTSRNVVRGCEVLE